MYDELHGWIFLRDVSAIARLYDQTLGGLFSETLTLITDARLWYDCKTVQLGVGFVFLQDFYCDCKLVHLSVKWGGLFARLQCFSHARLFRELV